MKTPWLTSKRRLQAGFWVAVAILVTIGVITHQSTLEIIRSFDPSRQMEHQRRAELVVVVFVIGNFISFALLTLVFAMMTREITRRQLLEEQLANDKRLLEQQYLRQAAMAEITLAITEPRELSNLLDRVAVAVTQFMPATAASVILWDAAQGDFVVSSSTVPGQQPELPRERVRRSDGATRWIVDHKKPLIVGNIELDPFSANSMLREYGIRSYAGVPLLIGGDAIGVLYALDAQAREYRANEMDFLWSAAARAALAISKVQLHEQLKDANLGLEERVEQRTAELRDSEERLRRLSTRLLQLQDQERRRIARELHDTTAQNLSAVTLNLERLREWATDTDERPAKILTESVRLAEQCLREIRTLSYLLHPPLLDETGLASALRWYADGFAKRSGIPVELTMTPDVQRLPVDVETTLFRVAQESLTNVHRHSRGTRAAIRLVCAPQTVTLAIEDNGQGMAGNKDGPARFGVGLMGMSERLHQLGGQLNIDSGQHGTKIIATLPVPAPQP